MCVPVHKQLKSSSKRVHSEITKGTRRRAQGFRAKRRQTHGSRWGRITNIGSDLGPRRRVDLHAFLAESAAHAQMVIELLGAQDSDYVVQKVGAHHPQSHGYTDMRSASPSTPERSGQQGCSSGIDAAARDWNMTSLTVCSCHVNNRVTGRRDTVVPHLQQLQDLVR
eukprot:3043877-Amphidinium_carterae.1